MKGFSGFGEGTNNSPVREADPALVKKRSIAKAADEALVEASKMGSDEVAETTRQMGDNLATMISRIGGNKDEKDKKDKKKNKNI